PVGDRNRRASLREAVERLLDEPLRLGVERARRLVEDEDRRVAQDRPRDRDPLLLAAGEAVAALADDGVVALGQRRDHLVDPGGPGRSLDLLVARVGLREAEVLANALVEEIRLLRDDADEVAQRREAQVADVDAVDRDAAARNVVQPGSEIAEGRLAGPGLAHERR